MKWYNDNKGFGLITPASDGEEVLVHFSAIGGAGFKTLTEGQHVELELTRAAEGLQASAVCVVS